MSDDEVTQIQFRAGQDDLETAKQQLGDVQAKLAVRNKEYEALEEKAAVQVPPPSSLLPSQANGAAQPRPFEASKPSSRRQLANDTR